MPSTVKVDLIPHEERAGFDPALIFSMGIVLASVLLFYVYSAWLENDVVHKRAVVLQLNSRVAEVQADVPKIEHMQQQNRSLHEQMEVIRALSSDPARYGSLLFDLAQRLPGNVWVSSITVDPATSSLTLSGTAASGKPLETIAQLMTALHQGSFRDATLTSATAAGPDAFTFQLETHYGRSQS